METAIPERNQGPLNFRVLPLSESFAVEGILNAVPAPEPQEDNPEPVVVLPQTAADVLSRVPKPQPTESADILSQVPKPVPEFTNQEDSGSPLMKALKAIDPYRVLTDPLTWHQGVEKEKARASNLIAASEILGVSPSEAIRIMDQGSVGSNVLRTIEGVGSVFMDQWNKSAERTFWTQNAAIAYRAGRMQDVDLAYENFKNLTEPTPAEGALEKTAVSTADLTAQVYGKVKAAFDKGITIGKYKIPNWAMAATVGGMAGGLMAALGVGAIGTAMNADTRVMFDDYYSSLAFTNKLTAEQAGQDMSWDTAYITALPGAIGGSILEMSEVFMPFLGGFITQSALKSIIKRSSAKIVADWLGKATQGAVFKYGSHVITGAAAGTTTELIQTAWEDVTQNITFDLLNTLSDTNLPQKNFDDITKDIEDTFKQVAPGMLVLAGTSGLVHRPSQLTSEQIAAAADEGNGPNIDIEGLKEDLSKVKPDVFSAEDQAAIEDATNKLVSGEIEPEQALEQAMIPEPAIETDEAFKGVSEEDKAKLNDALEKISSGEMTQDEAETKLYSAVVSEEPNQLAPEEEAVVENIKDVTRYPEGGFDAVLQEEGNYPKLLNAMLDHGVDRKLVEHIDAVMRARAAAVGTENMEDFVNRLNLSYEKGLDTTDQQLKSYFESDEGLVGSAGAYAGAQSKRIVKTFFTAIRSQDPRVLYHELGHVFWYDLSLEERELAASIYENANGEFDSELFANDFSKYVRSGEAQTGLKGLYDRFSEWLKNLSAVIRKTTSPERAKYLDSLLGRAGRAYKLDASKRAFFDVMFDPEFRDQTQGIDIPYELKTTTEAQAKFGGEKVGSRNETYSALVRSVLKRMNEAKKAGDETAYAAMRDRLRTVLEKARAIAADTDRTVVQEKMTAIRNELESLRKSEVTETDMEEINQTFNDIRQQREELVELSKNDMAIDSSAIERLAVLEQALKKAIDSKNMTEIERISAIYKQAIDAMGKEARRSSPDIKSVLNELKKKLAASKPSRAAGTNKLVGKYTAAHQSIFDKLRDISKIKEHSDLVAYEKKLLGEPESYSRNLQIKYVQLRMAHNTGQATVSQAESMVDAINTLEGIAKTVRKQADKDYTQKLREARQAVNIAAERTAAKQGKVGEEELAGTRSMVQRIWDSFRHGSGSYKSLIDILDVWATPVLGKNFIDNIMGVFGETKQSQLMRQHQVRKLLTGYAKVYGYLDDKGQPDIKLAERKMYDEEREASRLVLSYARKDVKGMPTGRMRQIYCNKPQLRKFWMELLDARVKEAYKADGMTDQDVTALYSQLTKEDVAFIEHQMEMYREYYPRINKVHQETRYTDLPFNENYSPIVSDLDTAKYHKDADDILSSMGLTAQLRGEPVNIRERVQTGNLTKRNGDVEVMKFYIRTMEHYINFTPKMLFVREVFADTRLKETVQDTYGKAYWDNLNKAIDYMINNGYVADKTHNAVDKTMQQIRLNLAAGVIGMKAVNVFKQTSSCLAFMTDMPAKDFGHYFIDFMSDPRGHYKELMRDSEWLQSRGENIDMELEMLTQSASYKNWLTNSPLNPTIRDYIMWFTKTGDMLGIVSGGWGYYKHKRQEYITSGLTSAEAHTKAIEDFERMADSTQQSAALYQQPMWRATEFGRLFTMFTSSQGQYLRIMLLAHEAWKAGAISKEEMTKQLFLFGAVLPAVFQAIAQGGASDEEDWWRIAHTVLTAPVATLPAGNAIEDAMTVLLLNTAWWAANANPPDYRIGASVPVLSVLTTGIGGLNQMSRQVYKTNANSYDVLDWMKAIRNGAQMAAALGIPATGLAGVPMAVANMMAGDDSAATFGKLALGMPPSFAIKDNKSGFTIHKSSKDGFTYSVSGGDKYRFSK